MDQSFAWPQPCERCKAAVGLQALQGRLCGTPARLQRKREERPSPCACPQRRHQTPQNPTQALGWTSNQLMPSHWLTRSSKLTGGLSICCLCVQAAAQVDQPGQLTCHGANLLAAHKDMLEFKLRQAVTVQAWLLPWPTKVIQGVHSEFQQAAQD